MLSCSKFSRGRAVNGLLVVLAVSLVSSAAFAQSDSNPKWDLFAGYQWLHPGGKVPTPFGDFNNPTGFNVPDMSAGFGAALTYNFDPHWGIEFDLGHNWGSSNYETTGSIGPRFMWRTDGANYFLHTMVSLNRLSVSGLNAGNGVGAILGGGMDLPIKKWLAFRLFEADYVWARHNYSSFASQDFPDLERPSFEGVRLRTGLVFSWGGAPAVTPAASCSVQPTEVMVGEPITATVTASNFNPKHTVAYAWSGNGGQVTGKDTTAQIDTTNTAPGSYAVTAHVTDPKMKNNNEASCTASYTIKPLPPKNPPTMSCSASPSSVQAGASVTVTCTCTSPDNVPVTVSNWTANSGTVSGSGNTATLSTNGAAPGTITISATCTDSRGLTGQASTQATVENPPPPPPKAAKLSQCDFPNEKKPWRVDNTCKAILDDVAKNLQQNPDSKLVIVGNAEPAEKRKNLAAERAVDSKFYLTEGEAKQGIDPSRIEVRTGSGGTKTAEYWIVPSGATFDSTGTQPVDESKIKAIPDHPKPAARKAAKKAQ
ncbi:MAG TPA: outer membrane beta-barrel protein [Candidatus Sulfotelmatobacter sp.]|nr:outer membrane beta-barrel protein [Candidatus Sulfotelmatobacter sp.]